MPDLFLKKGFPSFYEAVLLFPIIRQIRAEEKQALLNIFTENLRETEHVLEIGAGTGCYTFEIAARVRSVVAVERASAMARVLQERIAQTGARNITVVESDVFNYKPAGKFDAAIAIGVLDYVTDWREFLRLCISYATKRVIFTFPQPGMWAKLYSVFGQISGHRIRIYPPEEIKSCFAKNAFKFHETGLKTRWTNGLTVIAVITLAQS